MPYVNPDILDDGLSELADADILHLCSAIPADYAGIAAVTLGNKASPTVSAPQARAVGAGRRVVITAITDGSETADGSATCVVLADTNTSRLMIVRELPEAYATATGATFKLNEWSIEAPTFDET